VPLPPNPQLFLNVILWDSGLIGTRSQVSREELRSHLGLRDTLRVRSVEWDRRATFSPSCLTPVGPCSGSAAWPAGACVHRLPACFSLADFGDSLSLAFFLGTVLLEGKWLSSSSFDHAFIHSTNHLLTRYSPGFPYFSLSFRLTGEVSITTRKPHARCSILQLQCCTQNSTLCHKAILWRLLSFHKSFGPRQEPRQRERERERERERD
jgi:hypothetical protein